MVLQNRYLHDYTYQAITRIGGIFMMTSSNGNIFALLGCCDGNLSVTGEFPSQSPVTRSFYVLFCLRLNKWLSKQSTRRWFETPSRSLWRHCHVRRCCPVESHKISTCDLELTIRIDTPLYHIAQFTMSMAAIHKCCWISDMPCFWIFKGGLTSQTIYIYIYIHIGQYQ